MKRLWFLILLLALAVVPGAADTAFQALTERTPPMQFKYDSGRYRRQSDPTVPTLYSHAWDDTTGLGIEAAGYYETATADGDTVGNWYWESLDPGIYYFVETTGADSVFTHPQYFRLGFKTAPDSSVAGNAIQYEAVDTEHLADSLLADGKYIKSRVLQSIHYGLSSVPREAIAALAIDSTKIDEGSIPASKLAADAAGLFRLPVPVVGDSTAASDTTAYHAIESTRSDNTVAILARGRGSLGTLRASKVEIDGSTIIIDSEEAFLPKVSIYSAADGDSVVIEAPKIVLRGGDLVLGTDGSASDSLLDEKRGRHTARHTFEDIVYFEGTQTQLGANGDTTAVISTDGKPYNDHGRRVQGTAGRRAYDEISDGSNHWLRRGMVDLDRDVWGELLPMRADTFRLTAENVYTNIDGNYVAAHYEPGVDSTWFAVGWILPDRTGGEPFFNMPGLAAARSQMQWACGEDSIQFIHGATDPTGFSVLFIAVRPGTR